MCPPSVAQGDGSLEARRMRAVGWVCVDSNAASKHPPALWSWKGKWRISPGSPEDDVTAPELVITGGNGGVKGSHRGRVAAHIHQARRRPFPLGGTESISSLLSTNWCKCLMFSMIPGHVFPRPICLKKSPSLGNPACFSKCMVNVKLECSASKCFSAEHMVYIYSEWVFVE